MLTEDKAKHLFVLLDSTQNRKAICESIGLDRKTLDPKYSSMVKNLQEKKDVSHCSFFKKMAPDSLGEINTFLEKNPIPNDQISKYLEWYSNRLINPKIPDFTPTIQTIIQKCKAQNPDYPYQIGAHIEEGPVGKNIPQKISDFVDEDSYHSTRTFFRSERFKNMPIKDLTPEILAKAMQEQWADKAVATKTNNKNSATARMDNKGVLFGEERFSDLVEFSKTKNVFSYRNTSYANFIPIDNGLGQQDISKGSPQILSNIDIKWDGNQTSMDVQYVTQEGLVTIPSLLVPPDHDLHAYLGVPGIRWNSVKSGERITHHCATPEKFSIIPLTDGGYLVSPNEHPLKLDLPQAQELIQSSPQTPQKSRPSLPIRSEQEKPPNVTQPSIANLLNASDSAQHPRKDGDDERLYGDPQEMQVDLSRGRNDHNPHRYGMLDDSKNSSITSGRD